MISVFATDISSDGRLLAVGCSGEILRVWGLAEDEISEIKEIKEQIRDPALVLSKEEAHDLGILSCAFQPTPKDVGRA